MSIHFQRAIESLKKRLAVLSSLAEEHLRAAVRAVAQRDAEAARRVIEKDTEIDEMEVEIEEECLKILALYHPLATDLRFIVAALKINTELERVGDLAVNIAERALFLATQPPVEVNFDFQRMAEVSQQMLKESLDALFNLDTVLARQVCLQDDVIDEMNREMYLQVQETIRKHPEQLESLIHMLSISRHLERVGDLASNIAEEVIYMVEGAIVRHHVEDYIALAEANRKRVAESEQRGA